MASPNEIMISPLVRLTRTLDWPAIFDVRTDEDIDNDPRMIPGARRHLITNAAGLVESLVA